jgi:transposase
MMGREDPIQSKLFYADFNLERRVRADHPLRHIARRIEFDFAYQEVADTYGANGNVSLPPPVLLKLMLLLVLYNVRSERELMSTLPERLDWLWFLGLDLDSPIPDHSVLSKARKRWGVEVFQRFFERIVWQCVQAGLVDGAKIFLDSSLIEANACHSSVIDTHSLKGQLQARYREFEGRLSEFEAQSGEPRGAVNRRYVSTTDPEAAIVARGKPQLLYQTHRAVDPRAEIITATAVTRGDVNEAHLLLPLWAQHQTNTRRRADTVVADSKYGTVDNFLVAHDHSIAAHIPDLKRFATERAENRGIFPDHRFVYDDVADTYRCPAGQLLKRKSFHTKRNNIDYAAAKKTCAGCALRPECTHNKMGRTITRHLRQPPLDRMRAATRSAQARRDIRIRQHLMERSFARASRFGFDHARWRGLWRVRIQEYLTAAIQNIEVLMRYGGDPRRRPGVLMREIGQPAASMKTIGRMINNLLPHPVLAPDSVC